MRIVVETDASIVGCPMPQVGEVWVNVEDGRLYEMREERGAGTIHGPYRSAHRIDAPETHYGCDPSVFVAVFDDAVRNGKWLKVTNADELLPNWGVWITPDGRPGHWWQGRDYKGEPRLTRSHAETEAAALQRSCTDLPFGTKRWTYEARRYEPERRNTKEKG